MADDRRQPFRQERTENLCGNTTHIFTNSASSRRMLSFFSKGGAVLLRAAPKTPLLSLPLSKSVVLIFGSLFIGGAILRKIKIFWSHYPFSVSPIIDGSHDRARTLA